MKVQAQAAVKVRPNLADVGWVEALLTNHYGDWLFYNHPTKATAAMVVVPALVVGLWIYVTSSGISSQGSDYPPTGSELLKGDAP